MINYSNFYNGSNQNQQQQHQAGVVYQGNAPQPQYNYQHKLTNSVLLSPSSSSPTSTSSSSSSSTSSSLTSGSAVPVSSQNYYELNRSLAMTNNMPVNGANMSCSSASAGASIPLIYATNGYATSSPNLGYDESNFHNLLNAANNMNATSLDSQQIAPSTNNLTQTAIGCYYN
jgi:hypothetical protein